MGQFRIIYREKTAMRQTNEMTDKNPLAPVNIQLLPNYFNICKLKTAILLIPVF